MEHENIPQEGQFAFLNIARVKRYFADLNIDLLQGKHIMADDYNSFQLVREYFDELKYYYSELYQLNLIRIKRGDNTYYFYLDFPDENKGKLYSSSRHKELSQQQIIIGIILINMYYDRYFEYPKEIFWENIRYEIEQSEFKELYKKLLWGEVRDYYTDKEWERVQDLFRRTISNFTQLGWLTKLSKGKDDIHFELKESIHRFAELYKSEIEDFPQFASKIKII